jgi:hypothetical protein
MTKITKIPGLTLATFLLGTPGCQKFGCTIPVPLFPVLVHLLCRRTDDLQSDFKVRRPVAKVVRIALLVSNIAIITGQCPESPCKYRELLAWRVEPLAKASVTGRYKISSGRSYLRKPHRNGKARRCTPEY